MKHLILLLFVFVITPQKIFSQTSWQILNSNTTLSLYGLYFINYNTGYVCGQNGIILKTTNGGVYWNQLSGNVSFQLTDICFQNDLTGYCTGYSGIIKTTDSGLTWFSVYSGSRMIKINCSDNVLYAGGEYGIFKSIDSGNSWTNLITGYSGTILGMHFLNADSGYGMGTTASMFITTNGGANWGTGLYWGPGDYSFGECFFFNPGYGFTIYSYSSGWPNYYVSYGIYKANNWFSWHQVYNSPQFGFAGITFTGVDTGYAVGGGWNGSAYQGSIIKTTNGGNNWFSQNIIINQILQDVFFLDSRTGYAVGRGGVIIKTTNGGVVSVNNTSAQLSEKCFLFQNFPNPFNPVTKINFVIPKQSKVKITVYDALGKVVREILNKELTPGEYEIEFNGTNLSTGLYFYKLESDNFKEVKRMMLLK